MSPFKFNLNKDKKFKDIYIIEPNYHNDKRGKVITVFERDYFTKTFKLDFKHDKITYSKKNVIRGLHGDSKTWKLVSCLSGEVFQVIVDMRSNSPTYMKYRSYKLNSKKLRFILIPPNFANGFCCLSKDSIYSYKLAYKGDYNDFENQFTLKWNDNNLKIKWPISNPILSKRDI
tara:strand:- start:50 stop:571 length:522 start_codon:yes stop_codon:yes gene_type:complete